MTRFETSTQHHTRKKPDRRCEVSYLIYVPKTPNNIFDGKFFFFYPMASLLIGYLKNITAIKTKQISFAKLRMRFVYRSIVAVFANTSDCGIIKCDYLTLTNFRGKTPLCKLLPIKPSVRMPREFSVIGVYA